MANKSFLLGAGDLTVYARIFNSDGQVWNGSAFVTFVDADVGNYDVAATEAGTSSGFYSVTMPAGITAAGRYIVSFYQQAGGSPAIGDAVIGGDEFDWNGTKKVALENFFARIRLTRLAGQDVYTVVVYFYGEQVLSTSLGSPTITVRLGDGSFRITAQALGPVSGTPALRYIATSPSELVSPGEDLIVTVSCTLGGASRTWTELLSRDATS